MREVFTSPAESVFPTPDNADGNLVVAKGDYIVKSESMRYMAIELLGTGAFGQVFRCVSNEGEEVAIKVVKSCNKFYQYEMNGLRIMKRLRDAGMTEHFVNLYDAFIYKNHLCIVQELLKMDMFRVLKVLRFSGLSMASLRNVLKQLLEGICEMQMLGITHCDLKPENVLVADYLRETVKIIDFGSSSTKTVSTMYYVQSRFYRAPEVILGIPYNALVDVWSLGCIAYELMMGEPLFPGVDNADQMYRIHEFVPGGIPTFMMDTGEYTGDFFDKADGYAGRENPERLTCYNAIERIYKHAGRTAETENFVDFMMRCLEPSYLERSSPYDLRKHEYFMGEIPRAADEQMSREEIATKADKMEPYGKRRKVSVFPANNKAMMSPLGRKGSLYDPSYENRTNRRN